MTYAKNDVAIHAFFFLARDFFFTKITTTTTFDSTNILFNELYYNSISGVSYSPCISRAPRCRFVKVIAHGRRDQRVEADRPSLPRITLTSIAQDSINLLDEFIREIFREIEMSKSYATMSPSREGNHLSIGFEIRTIRALLSSSFSSRVFVHGGDVLARGL